MSKVELQNITKIYDKTIKALDDISFTVNDGEFFVLLGPTGAGKTTTLRSIAGLEKIDKGKILFDDEDFSEAQPAACLLYTSPSPRDSCASRMPSSA